MRKSKKGVANVFTTATGVLKAGVSAIRDAMAPAQTSAGDMPSIRFETLEPRVAAFRGCRTGDCRLHRLPG